MHHLNKVRNFQVEFVNYCMTVLYIDDDSDDREIFKEAFFKVSPYSRLLTASGGNEAFSLLKNESPPDYIFLDINMPIMSGKEFLRQIKSAGELKHIPIVVYSTTKDEKEREEYLKMGAVDVIAKSQTFADTCNILKNIV
jgi:CheY-like chemotaxis protein